MNRFKMDLTDKLSLKDKNKNMALAKYLLHSEKYKIWI